MCYLKIIFYVLLPILIINLTYKKVKPKIKGYFGERKVQRTLKKLNSENYYVINNVLIKSDEGTTQIDHIVVSKYGIFVIETKNYSGWIFGNDKLDEWTETFYKKKIKFRNPTRQNYGHIQALSKLFDLAQEKFISIVTFSNKSTLNVESKTHVIPFRNLRNCISKYVNIIITEEKVAEIRSKLIMNELYLSGSRKQLDKQHIKKIKENITETKFLIAQKKCPKCGGNLLEKKGKYGDFYGCSNFPKCRFTLKK